MLKSMKQKLSGTRRATGKEEGPSNSKPQHPGSRERPSAHVGGGAGGKQQPAPSNSAPQSLEKPPLPSLTQENLVRVYADVLPSFRDVPNPEKQLLFVKKLHLCSFSFDFSDPSSHVREKELKRQTLLELVEYVNAGQGKFSEAVSEDIIFMLSSNLFRALPPSRSHGGDTENYDPEEEEPLLELAWPHLQIVYEFLLRYVVSNDTDAKVARKYIDQNFVVRLLELFDSEDPRERDYLKTILHRIYGKFMVHRPFIRKAVNHVFYRFIYETERHNGIAELLEILGSIINGFALPLKEEHKNFLHRALMPLHKPKCVAMYHQQLAYCVTQFVEKDSKLADSVIQGLLKFWPVTNSQKEVLFLSELEELLELTQAAEFSKIMVPLFKQIGRCLNSSHFQVAERSLFLWNNEYIVSLVAQHRQAVLPLVYGPLERNVNHWNPAVNGLTMNVRKMLIEMDEPLVEDCKRRYEADEAQAKDAAQQSEQNWKALEEAASKRKK
mmetsp:Transcript_34091/g.96633  ORF Transcript_34091/g.96633 Transcript_34091/m.96633 type:complete len:497 (-) Transcript_34091:439-1929(-)